MSFDELASGNLDYQQKAPLGLLWIIRALTLAFGNSEMVLRFVPLMSSIAALFLFLPVARYFLKTGPGLLVAIGVIAFSPPLVYHSVEAKQYSTELLATVLLLLLYIKYHTDFRYRSLLIWGVFGALIVWFSYSSIFILSGIAASISLGLIIKKNYSQFFRSLIPFSFWIISFGISYLFFTTKTADSHWLVVWFNNRDGFMSQDILRAGVWLVRKSVTMMDYPLGLSWLNKPNLYRDNPLLLVLARMTVIPITFFFAGLIYGFKKYTEKLYILTLPILLHIIASAFLLYPFFERLLVYLAPLLILIIAIGLEFFVSEFDLTKRGSKSIIAGAKFNRLVHTGIAYKIRRSLFFTLPLMLLVGPISNSAYEAVKTDRLGRYKHWEQREMYEYLNAHFQEGDAVYIYWNALVPYNYYKNVLDLKFNAIQGKDYRFSSNSLSEYYGQLRKDLKKLKSSANVWFIYSIHRDIKIGDMDNEPRWYYNGDNHLKHKMPIELSVLGTQLDSVQTLEDMDLLLYDNDRKSLPK